MAYAVTVNSLCAGGGHLHVTISDGKDSKAITVHLDPVAKEPDPETEEQAVAKKIKAIAEAVPSREFSDIKTAIEAAPIEP